MRLRILAAAAVCASMLAPVAAQAKDGAPEKPTLEWIGFRPQAGGASEVFFIMTHAVAPREIAGKDRVYLIFDGVVPGRRNHLRALDTRFFESTVKWVRAKKIGKKGCQNCAGDKKERKAAEAAGVVPAMAGPGMIVTITFRANASNSYQLSQEDTTFDPAEANGPREGVSESGKPKAAPKQRRMIRLAFPPPGNDVAIGGDLGPDAMKQPMGTGTGSRPKLEEPKAGTIVIPPASDKK